MAINVTDPSATALTVAASGTNYGLQIDESATSAATGVKVTAQAAGAGVAVSALSPNSNDNLIIDAKGSGAVSVGSVSTGSVLLGSGGGNVGIGTTSPDARLHVNTTGTGQFAMHINAGEDSKIVFDGGNNLTLQVLGSDSGIRIGTYSGTSDARIDFYANGHGSTTLDLDVRIVAPPQGWAGTGNGLLRFLAKTVEVRYVGTVETRRSLRLRIDEGLGAEPRYTGIVSLNKNDGGKTVLEFSVDDSELQPGDAVRMKLDNEDVLTLGDSVTSGNRMFKFRNSGASSLLQHTPSGGLLICSGSGDLGPEEDVRLVVGSDGIITIGYGDSAADRVLKFRDSAGSALIQYQSGGGIQFSTDNADLSPGNAVRLRIAAAALSASSSVYTEADGKTLTTTAPSAREYKDNIVEFEPNLSRFYDLKVMAFNWKATGESDCGFLADEIATHVPELYRHDERVTGWKADRFPFYLFQALKELKLRVDAIEERAAARQ